KKWEVTSDVFIGQPPFSFYFPPFIPSSALSHLPLTKAVTLNKIMIEPPSYLYLLLCLNDCNKS
ncbi:MAG: hypothetical protein RI565_10800, partial [Schleiferiaceae bacterium]|nr:hypothetical protein [Schleiferiaceae bacterium]